MRETNYLSRRRARDWGVEKMCTPTVSARERRKATQRGGECGQTRSPSGKRSTEGGEGGTSKGQVQSQRLGGKYAEELRNPPRPEVKGFRGHGGLRGGKNCD